MKQPDEISLPRAAKLLGVSYITLRRWILWRECGQRETLIEGLTIRTEARGNTSKPLVARYFKGTEVRARAKELKAKLSEPEV